MPRIAAAQADADLGWVVGEARADDIQAELAEAGLRDARLHDARRTAATVLLILGVSTPTAMALMGWSSAAMAKRYQHLIDTIRRDVAKQVGGLLWDADDASYEPTAGANEARPELGPGR